MSYLHVKTNAVADFTGTITGFNSQGSTVTLAATDLVRPSDWNSGHAVVVTITGLTAGQSTGSGTNLVYGGSNGMQVSLSTAAGVMTLWVGPPPVSTWNNMDLVMMTTAGQQANNSASIVPLRIDEPVSGSVINLFGSLNVGTAANASTAAINYSLSVLLATLNGQTLQTLSSGSTATGITWSSNNTSGVTGGMIISAPVNCLMTPGKYFAIVQLSTAATGNVLTGAATTSLGNTLTMVGAGTAQFGAFSFRPFTSAASNSTLGVYSGGLNSSTGNLTQVSMSNVSQVGTFGQRGGGILLQIRA